MRTSGKGRIIRRLQLASVVILCTATADKTKTAAGQLIRKINVGLLIPTSQQGQITFPVCAQC